MANISLHSALENKPKKRAFFKPSKRLEEISKPKHIFVPTIQARDAKSFGIKKSALRYKCTPRIDSLAVPLKRQHWNPKPKGPEPTIFSYFKVPQRALKAKLTPRITQLAQPRGNKSHKEIRLKKIAGKEATLIGSKASKRTSRAKKDRARRRSISVETRNQDDRLSKNEKNQETPEPATFIQLQTKAVAAGRGSRAESKVFIPHVPLNTHA